MRFLIPTLLCSILVSASASGTNEAPYNSATISGLGARNIGSAAMSGRISAIEGVKEPSGKITLFVGAASGGIWSDSPDRGLYRTTDGGKNWELALKGSNLSTGCSAVAIDPNDSNVMFAALWDFRRKGWFFRSGGDGPDAPSGSGLFRSSDGGNTWNEITSENSKGFPKKPYGRIAVAVGPSNSKRVNAAAECT